MNSTLFISLILIFINLGLIFLIIKYRKSNIAIFRVGLIALIFIDLLSILALIKLNG